MKRLALNFVLPALLWGAAAAAAGGRDPDLEARVRMQMQPFVARGEVSGLVAMVGRPEGITALVSLGKRRLNPERPMRPDTLFRIASMTKPITAIGIMMLVDEGKLDVRDPVEKHLPEFRGQRLVIRRSDDEIVLGRPPRPITLHDLLTHTSGMPGGPPPGMGDLYVARDRTLAEGVAAFSQQPLLFPPGARWSYSNPGIDTLGRVIEKASGQSFESFMQRRVFDPLDMKDTVFYPGEAELERAAEIHEVRDGRLAPSTAAIIGTGRGGRYPIPAGGLMSTAPDLARLYRMMLNGGQLDGKRILSQASVRTMTALQTGDIVTGFVPGMGFGYGWAHVRRPEGVTARLSPGSYGHGGAFGTQAWIDPRRETFVVLMIARTGLPNADASEMRRALQEAALPPL